jgi:hypothetical protein
MKSALSKIRAEMGHSSARQFLEDLARVTIGKPIEKTRVSDWRFTGVGQSRSDG